MVKEATLQHPGWSDRTARAREAARQCQPSLQDDGLSIDELQVDLDYWIREYIEARPHQGRWCFGKTPMRTFLDAMPIPKEKMIALITTDTITRPLNQTPTRQTRSPFHCRASVEGQAGLATC
jgi:hypothetical protein